MLFRSMDDQMTLSKFQRIFLQTPSNQTTIIPEREEDSLKSAPFSPLIIHISHDGSGFEQVDPLKIHYKRDLTPSAQGMFDYSPTYYHCILERKLT